MLITSYKNVERIYHSYAILSSYIPNKEKFIHL